jgi:hypothetical protein
MSGTINSYDYVELEGASSSSGTSIDSEETMVALDGICSTHSPTGSKVSVIREL